jgi:class 3 adenylate cyclase
MVHFIHFKNPTSTEIEEKLRQLPKCPGTCFFIDIINSTDIKYKTELWQWGKKLNNTFNFISFLNDIPDHVVKGIGDELMFYIPDTRLKEKNFYNSYLALLEEIYATIDNIKNYPLEDVFLNCKVSIHYCTDVYNITFIEDHNDYYGRDIDLTARLMSKATSNRIVLSEKFYTKVINDLIEMNLQKEDTFVKLVSDKYMEDFKGVPRPTEYRILQV